MGNNCKRNSWIAAVVLGIIVFLIALPGFFGALVLGVIAALILGFGLTVFVCRDEGTAPNAASDQAPGAVAAPAAAPAPAPAPEAAQADRPANAGAATASPATAKADTAAKEKPASSPGKIADTETKGGTEPAAPVAAPPEKPAVADATAATAADGEGTKPAGLSAPRDGKADDLRKIKGVGPKLQSTLNEMGYYHYDQIAAWTAEEVAWVDQNLKGFKGRVSRDNWVDQAKQLATGEGTEFSKRVDDGDVY
ncbi:endonuclease [Pseudooceanicola sp.]|uniref:endonuclease n=1 Tax=Pseudooceanicola sp. TaxID=1914328 RepID=UPI0035C77D03